MGYTYRNNGAITDYEPDDTATEMYLRATTTLSEILDRIKEKWGDCVKFEDVEIEAKHIHTRCLTYDLHDASDYDDFILVTYCPN